ncbi:MAG: NADH-quinone oxidoreductase subunit NuoG [Actinomycetia bacterium]|nr:NADH-quinone oxidoreductase subunit NuoG [Actinomycetes bacterium]
MAERPRDIDVTDPVGITVNGESITAQDGELLIDACERNGAWIPRFCYHPRMSPVGMCRMCLVEVDSGRGPALQPSCMIPVTDGMTVDTENDTVAKAQDGVLEFLLANHPLDCPVCDKGGECPLQDQAYAYGPGESRFVEEKRHFAKPIPISETVYLDRERCILCDRCTRFADEVAGEPLIHFINRGSGTEVNTFPGEPFSSYFSGNTVQICPVGALTAKPYRFKARPWDLEATESTCTRCSMGCTVTLESSRNELLRLQGVDSDPVNWSWLCDKGRFGFEAANSDERVSDPLVRGEDGELASARWHEALTAAAGHISSAVDGRGPQSVAMIGGARLTNEAQYAWSKLARKVIGTDNVDAQVGDGLPAPVVLGLPGATIDDVCAPGSTVLWLASDPIEDVPVMHLRMRHAASQDGVKVIEVTPRATALGDLVAHRVPTVPGAAAATVASLLAGEPPEGASGAAEVLRAAGDDLKVVVGRSNLAESADCVVDAIAAVRQAVPGATFLTLLDRGNIRGALEAGLAPGMGPGGLPLDSAAVSEAWGTADLEAGLDTAGILEDAAKGRIEVLVLLGADPLVDFPDRSLARRALSGVRTVISVDPFVNESARSASVVLAAAALGEVSGTTTNFEGRVSAVQQLVTPPGTARADWLIAVELAAKLGGDLGVESSASELLDELVALSPAHAPLASTAPGSPEAVDGVLVDLAARPVDVVAPGIEVPPANAYSQRLLVTRTLYDRGTLLAHSPSSAELAPAAVALLSPADAAPLGIDSGTRVKVTSQHGTITLPARADASVGRGVAVIHHNLAGGDPGALVNSADAVCDVRVEVA